MDIKVVNAGNCMMCGKEIKVAIGRGMGKFPNIFFCEKCDEKMTIEEARDEARARWICCPLCDKEKCERSADDCDVNIHLKNKKESEEL